MQKRIKEYEWFKNMDITFRCLVMMLIFATLPGIALGSVMIPKGVYLYFGLSFIVFVQFYTSCKSKKYSFFTVLLYDVLLTALLMTYGYFLPTLNFVPLTLKDLVIFWNFYIGLYVFGLIAARVGIKIEIAEEVFVD